MGRPERRAHRPAQRHGRGGVGVVFNGSALFFELDQPNRPGRLAAFGLTAAGRGLAVYLDAPTARGSSYVLTARPITTKERNTYDQLKEAES